MRQITGKVYWPSEFVSVRSRNPKWDSQRMGELDCCRKKETRKSFAGKEVIGFDHLMSLTCCQNSSLIIFFMGE